MNPTLFALIGAERAAPTNAPAVSVADNGNRAAAALALIVAWRCGCTCRAGRSRPEDCPECTRAMVDAVERALAPAASAADDGEAPIRLVLNLEQPTLGTLDSGDAGGWQPVGMTEPSCSGTYEVRLGPGATEPVFELPFDAEPGGGWMSGEQPPADYVVLPVFAQWRPIRGRGRR